MVETKKSKKEDKNKTTPSIYLQLDDCINSDNMSMRRMLKTHGVEIKIPLAYSLGRGVYGFMASRYMRAVFESGRATRSGTATGRLIRVLS